MAEKLLAAQNPQRIPNIIREESIPYLKVGVGSEMAMLLKPDLFWTCNIRTIWAHFAMETSVQNANDLANAYHDKMPSDMDYLKWKEIFPLVGSSMEKLASLGDNLARAKGIEPGDVMFLWADAIANSAYNVRLSVRQAEAQ